jgi:hypothetical protein
MIRTRVTRDASADKASGSKQTLRSLIRFWSPGYSPSTTRDELIETTTDDVLKLRIEYLRSRTQTESKPVVLQRGLAANGFVFNYPGHSLAAYLSERGFDCYRDQAIRFSPRSLLISGSRDLQCPSEAVEETVRRLSGAREVRVMHCGTKHGHAREYRHIDLILGKNAQHEVWPHLLDWLMIP